LDGQNLRMPFVFVQLVYAVGTFFASFTPGGVGSDIFRTFHLQQLTNRGFDAGISILISRLLSLLVLLLAAMVASLARPGLPIALTVPIALLGLLACAGVFLGARPLSEWLARLGPSMPGAALFSRAAHALDALKQAPGLAARTALLFVAYHLLSIMPIYFVALGLGVDLPLIDVVTLGLLLRLADFLPISVGGIGVHEAGLIILFGPLGLGPSDAIALSILERLALLSVPLIGGIAYLNGWSSMRPSKLTCPAEAHHTTSPSLSA
jgi:uncharacterized membrane protein YbhN (UPF0104 family)